MSKVSKGPAGQEATRLLCVGAYTDRRYRRQIIEELVEHEERPVATSLGCDVLPVLAHALRARRWEAVTGLTVLLVWAAFAVVNAREAAASATVWVLLWGLTLSARRILAAPAPGRAGQARQAPSQVTVLGFVVVLVVFANGIQSLVGWALAGTPPRHALLFLPLLAVPVWVHRVRTVLLMRRELSQESFDAHPTLRLPDTRRYRRIGAAIGREQFSPLCPYRPGHPLIGFGITYDAWSFVLELRPKDRAAEDGADRPPPPGELSNRDVLDLIRPQVASLRLAGPATARDRLSQLKVDECVCLPVYEPRQDMPYGTEQLRECLREAVNDDGEARRHFLRVRITAWGGQLVVTVLVRVHTQGSMLVLEVAPHVLAPARAEFESAARAASDQDRLLLGNTVLALLSSPVTSTSAAFGLLRTVLAVTRTWLRRPPRSKPDGPRVSVRELGGTNQVTLFQEMDVSRYVKTVQDRITNGVLQALRSKGYDTREFERQTVTVGQGAIYIGAMSGGVASTGARTDIHYTRGDRHGTARGRRPTPS
ncbi:hypothetical protein ACH4FX_42550 [Streptomyces sp. NPDC018019]|uniref:hypothetical protein n=1 Tax=Streptomyces sp. NPDC018019 TaxID=3365030 RepID=UPI0037BCC0E7